MPRALIWRRAKTIERRGNQGRQETQQRRLSPHAGTMFEAALLAPLTPITVAPAPFKYYYQDNKTMCRPSERPL
jgi:hypothetical protein